MAIKLKVSVLKQDEIGAVNVLKSLIPRAINDLTSKKVYQDRTLKVVNITTPTLKETFNSL